MKSKKMSITKQIVIAMLFGIVVGSLFGARVEPIKVFGNIFFNLIQMPIIILIMGLIIEAVGNINPSELGKKGLKTILVFAISSLLAAGFGIAMAVIFEPGKALGLKSLASGEIQVNARFGSLSEIILGLFPKNIFQSMSEGTIVHVIVFSILFGIALGYYKSEKQNCHLFDIIVELNIVVIKLITMVMKIAPIGIFSLIASTIGTLGIQVMIPLAKYLLIYGLSTILFLIIWVIVVSLYCKVGVLQLIKNMSKMSIMALATTSSAITLPTVLEDSEKKLGIGNSITRLVLPLGMSLNSNGSAMHMAITVITISQIYSVRYDSSAYVYIAVIATLVSLANAVVPGAGLVSLAMVIPYFNLPIESIAIFAGVEWIVGMYRTILNVDSDVFSALLVAKSENAIDYDIFRGKL